MPAIQAIHRRKLAQFSEMTLCNPFSPERLEREQAILGSDFQPEDMLAWSRRLEDGGRERPNVTRLTATATEILETVREAVGAGKDLPPESLRHYWNVATYVLLYRHIVPSAPDKLLKPATTKRLWNAFRSDYRQLTNLPGLKEADTQPAGHLFALLTQVHRAFHNIYLFILGDSLPSVQLRAAVWESIFTCDLERYRSALFSRMSQLPSLVTGPSGTGKELVARAIGLSQYVPFNEEAARFDAADASGFFALNLSAMSANLIESELFGHRKGAFTGAIADRQGWLELCPAHGAIFLDEIGELEPGLQVKLLRVVQQRTFSRLGETTERTFAGKLIGATNRDLGEEMQAGRFREDLYYRLCADRIQTPSLRQQLDDRPDDLRSLTEQIARRVAGEDSGPLADRAFEWVLENLGAKYPWRGNIRELEQCISSIMIRNEYVPARSACANDQVTQAGWTNDAVACKLTADQLLQRYCTWTYYHTNSYEAAARKLKLDRRTIKAKVDASMLKRLQSPEMAT